MFKVTAVANGYYGLKHRVPGEVFGIEKAEHFSIEWMDSDEPKVLAHVRERAKTKGDYADWLETHKHSEPAAPTRRVNTGGTDGVVGIELPAPGTKLSAKERIALANQISGRTDVASAKDADVIIAAAEASGGSANDDRTRDMASDPDDNAPWPVADADTDTDI